MPQDLPRRYLRLAEAHLPEALPVRYGTHTPPQGNFARDGEEDFVKTWQESVGGFFGVDEATFPVSWVSFGTIRQQREGDARGMRAFHATAEVVRNYSRRGTKLFPGPDAEAAKSLIFVYRLSSQLRYEWVGLKPYPVWWMWFGTLYEDGVRPYLAGRLEEYPEGVFHSWAEAPANRDELTALLPDPTRSWIPAEFSPLYQEGSVGPLALATNVPLRLREVRVPPHRWTTE
ncbi:hypothetical protein SCMU_39480 [Sinomonas cyclohexanicum]|uniref:Uncharacterized protein n=1 Tax=Sinomonas cyclohexanicum TaxID=322009 RepID=A0ABN6FQA9_SINCY|nr:hypothetical protein [Corynebacterium cyclohexanicum]BCT78106.1 hypothetical protein SCMU_39480 [Corynebacterium cyclohexanicum]